MLETISLRPANPGDEGLLRLIYAETRREELDQVDWPEGARDAFLRQQFDAQSTHYSAHYPDAEFLIVERDGMPIGRLYVNRGATEIRIMDIALLPDARGQQIGTKLLRGLLDEGEATGKSVSIHVEKFNRALLLYERLGFQIKSEHGAYWLLQWLPASAAS